MDSSPAVPSPVACEIGYGSLLAEHLLSVFRAHLAWNGDPETAQSLTEATLRLALRWQGGYRPQEYSPGAWFLGMARSVHFSAPRPRPGRSPGPPLEIPTPLASLAQTAHFSTLLSRLRPETADALVLTCFGGLPPAEAAEVLGGGERRLARLLAGGLDRLTALTPRSAASFSQNAAGPDLAEGLAALAGSIQPNPDWLRGLQAQAQAGQARSIPRPFTWLLGSPFRWIRLLRWLKSWLRFLPVLLLGLAGLVWALNNLLPPADVPLAQPQPAANFSLSINPGVPAGVLVPPEAALCQRWQAVLAKDFPGRTTLASPVVFGEPDPGSQNQATVGWACQVTVAGSQADSFSMTAALPTYLGMLKSSGFIVTYQCDPQDFLTCHSGLFVLENGGLRVLIVNDELPGSLPDTLKPRLYIQITSNAAQTALETFFNAWMAGDSAALDFLSPDLRRLTPTLAGLDHRAGFARALTDSLKLTWKVTENTGSSLRVSVQESLNAGQPYLFQVVLADLEDRWQVSALAPGIFFPPSQDAVYWAGQDGAVYHYSLADQSLQAVTAPGIYNPRLESVPEGSPPTPPEISPDGDWLALYPYGQTILVDLLHRGVIIRLPPTGSLAWTRDGRRIAFVQKDRQPGDIYRLDAPFTGEPILLAGLTDEVTSLAWSPDGSQLAALSIRSTSAATPSSPGPFSGQAEESPIELRDVSLISAAGQVRRLAMLDCPANHLAPNQFDLAWTGDGQEVWYRSFNLAIRARDGATLALIDNPQSGIASSVQQSALWPVVLANGRPAPIALDLPAIASDLVSPDGRWSTPNPAAEAAWSVNRVSLAPVGPAQAARWSDSFPKSVYSLAWTADSRNLVAGSGREYQAGWVVRLSAVTGENQALADNVFWIGVSSDLQARSLAQALQASVQVIPADLAAVWPCHTVGIDLSCLRVPPGWLALDVTGETHQAHWLATNLVFPAPLGWSSPQPGLVSIDIYSLPGPGNQTVDQLLQGLPAGEQGSPWEPVTVDGVTGVHLLSGLEAGQSSLLLPTRWGTLRLNFSINLPGGYNSPVVQRILQSIRF